MPDGQVTVIHKLHAQRHQEVQIEVKSLLIRMSGSRLKFIKVGMGLTLVEVGLLLYKDGSTTGKMDNWEGNFIQNKRQIIFLAKQEN